MPPARPPSGRRKRTMLDAAVGSGKASESGGRIAVPITGYINTGGIMPRNGTRILLTAMVGLLLAAAPAAAQKQVLHMAYWGGPSHQMVQTQAGLDQDDRRGLRRQSDRRGRQGALGKSGGPIRPDQERRARSRLGGARLHGRPVRYAAGRRAAASVPRSRCLQPDPVEVVRQIPARRQGIHRYQAAGHFHGRPVSAAHRQARQNAR